MVKKFYLVLSLMLMSAMVLLAADKGEQMKYDIVSAGATGAQGTYLVKVSVYSKRGKTTSAELQRAAVHGVIFKGVVGGNGMATQKPMATPTTEYEKADFFEQFLTDGGPYSAYASVEGATISRAKTPTGEYRVSAVVVVSKDELRKYLEQAGIVRGLGSIF